MADPLTASIQIAQVALGAVKTGAAVAQWWQTRQTLRAQNTSSAEENFGGFYRQKPEDLLYVMATMGQWMFSLEVVNYAALPPARVATRQAFHTGDPDDDDLGELFDSMDELVQNAVTSGMAFCADCWPMHMWKGFGCGVFNELRWADPNHSNIHCLELDNSITALKSQPHQWRLLNKSPSAISKTDPQTEALTGSDKRRTASLTKDVIGQLEKDGFPQPLPPFEYIRILYWGIPFATWNGNSMFQNELHNTNAISKYQLDPGRFLWAWTAGRQAAVSPGEAWFLAQDHIGALAQWLEGLVGIPFRVLLDNQLDHSNIKFPRSTRNMLKKIFGNEHGIVGAPMVIVHDPYMVVRQAAPQQLATDFSRLSMSSTLTSTNMSYMSPTTPMEPPEYSYSDVVQSPTASGISFPEKNRVSKPPRRRPVPQPSTAALRIVKGTHDFAAEADEELSFSAGDLLEIIDDKAEDGWWKAKLNGKTGLIPSTFVKDVDREEEPTQRMKKLPDVSVKAMEPEMMPPTAQTITELPNTQPITPPVTPPTTQGTIEPLTYTTFQPWSNNDVKNYQDANTGQLPISPPVIPREVYSAPATETKPPQDSPPMAATMSANIVNWETDNYYWPEHSLATSQWQPQEENEVLLPQAPIHTPYTHQPQAQESDMWNPDQTALQPSILHTLNGHSKPAMAVAFSPSGDLLASGSRDKAVKLWDTSTGRPQHQFDGHELSVESVYFAPDGGRVLASASSDRTVRLWDVRTNMGIHMLKHPDSAYCVAISPDARMLAVGMMNDKIQLWDARSLSVLHVLKGHKSMVNSVAFSPDGSMLATGSNDKTVRTWEPYSGQPRQNIKAHPGMMNYVLDVAFSPDGTTIASGSLDGSVKLWNAGSGVEFRKLECGASVRGVDFSPDGQTIAAVTASNLQLWSADGTELYSVLSKNTNSVAFAPGGRILATASEDKTVKLWRVK